MSNFEKYLRKYKREKNINERLKLIFFNSSKQNIEGYTYAMIYSIHMKKKSSRMDAS